MSLLREKDPMGKAIVDFFNKKKCKKLWVYSNITEKDELLVSYLFRSVNAMPAIEQCALKLCKGKVLDVGAAAGAHSKCLQNNGFEVTPIDLSDLAVQTMKRRDLKNAQCVDFYYFSTVQKFDTLLFLMNGVGLAGSVNGLNRFFQKCEELLATNGQILVDSSDISYMYDGDYEKPKDIYYGEVDYTISYGDITSDTFSWLFIDFETFKRAANSFGFSCTKILEGPHFDFLAKLTRFL